MDQPDRAPQDDLWLTATFNNPVDWTPGAAGPAAALTPLAKALIRFQYGYDSLRPSLDLLAGARGAALAQLFKQLVQDVLGSMAAGEAKVAAPGAQSLQWVLRCAESGAQLFQPVGAAPRVWPAVNGQPYLDRPQQTGDGPGPGRWWMARYPVPAASAPLKLSFAPFDLLTHQTAVASVHVVRNADIGAGTVNPLLVYTTPEVSFPNVVVPYVGVTGGIAVDGGGAALSAVLSDLLAPLATAGTALAGRRFLQLSSTYRYALGTPAAVGVRAQCGAVMMAGEEITEGNLPALAARLAAELAAWRQERALPDLVPGYSFNLALFAEVGTKRIPVLSLQRLEVSNATNAE